MEPQATRTVPSSAEPRRAALRLPRTRWLVIGTIALIAASTAFVVGLPMTRRAGVIGAIERMGGMVRDEWVGPTWLERSVRSPWRRPFHRVRSVALRGSPSANDALLEQLRWLSELEALDLGDTAVTDAGVMHLRELQRLKELRLSDTRIPDTALTHLKNLPNLESLVLTRTGVTDAGVVHLLALPALTALRLDETQITDAGLARLATLKNLNRLSVTGTQVTSEGVARLQRALPGTFIQQ